MHEYIVCADIASKRDRYSEIVFKRSIRMDDGNPTLQKPDRILSELQCVWIKQEEGLRYEQMEQSFVTLVRRPQLLDNCDQLVDGTGVGDAVIEGIRKRGALPISIVFTNGGRAHPVYAEMGQIFGDDRAGKLSAMRTVKEWLVPRRDLVADGALLLEQGRLAIAKGVAHREAFSAQLNGFRLNRKKQRYEAETEDLHDDLVVCYFMAAWWVHYFENEVPEGEIMAPTPQPSWDPLAAFDVHGEPERETPPMQSVQSWR